MPWNDKSVKIIFPSICRLFTSFSRARLLKSLGNKGESGRPPARHVTQLRSLMMRFVLSLVLSAAVAAFSLAADGEFKLSGENTKIGFTGTKKDGKHTGTFPKLTGTITIPGGKVTDGKIDVTIDMTGVESDDAKLTEHLKGADFFDVKTNPKATFVSTKIEGKDAQYTVTGDFTLNGKKKSISFPAVVVIASGQCVLSADFKIDRTDYGIKYGQGKIDNAVAINIALTAK
jgi:polyisoprenoid-binding protein YceI